jgi:hypothetical protein
MPHARRSRELNPASRAPRYPRRRMTAGANDIGAAHAGSQLQTQLYVNWHTPQLDEAIRAVFPQLANATFEWRSPLAGDQYREYFWDAAFLERLDLHEHVDALKRFWPTGGPHWDALALVHVSGEDDTGVLLAEGKSYPNEMLRGSPAGATDPTSRARIEKTLAWTQGRLGVALDTDPWVGPLYQNANRLAHLCWLRSRGVRAWLAHLLFTDDPHGPTSADEWEHAVRMPTRRSGLTESQFPLPGMWCYQHEQKTAPSALLQNLRCSSRGLRRRPRAGRAPVAAGVRRASGSSRCGRRSRAG